MRGDGQSVIKRDEAEIKGRSCTNRGIRLGPGLAARSDTLASVPRAALETHSSASACRGLEALITLTPEVQSDVKTALVDVHAITAGCGRVAAVIAIEGALEVGAVEPIVDR